MADDIKAIFASVKEEAKDFATALWQCCEKIHNELPQNYEADIDPELQLTFLTNKLNEAIKTLCDGLDNPTLILATTGTTSSGKSTLVNLLCGAELMPVSVQEMSAGVVTIEYSDQKAIKIDETTGAQWECGTWYNVSNEDIYSRLERVMTTYRNIREDGGSGIACPQSTIYYPFRLVSEAGLLDLPEGTTVKIMDLPGLAGVNDDEGNTEAIRKSKEALCLVTYNSAETDKAKVASLLQEIVDQVKELGGSPARMLFILNRIDVFRSDNNWPQSEELFCHKTGQDIRNKLKGDLGEYESEIDDIEIVKLSSLPALLSLEMINGNDVGKIKASEKLDSFFGKLMPEDVLNDLPRQADRWTDHDRQRLYNALWIETNAEAFHQHLKQHIQNEYPQLILPQIIERFKDDAAFSLIEWACQTTRAVINSSEEKYQVECERIQDIKVNLDQSINQKTQALREPFDAIKKTLQDALNGKAGAGDPINNLQKIISGLGKNEYFDPVISKQLQPLHAWSIVLTDAIKKISLSIIESFDKGKSMVVGNKAFEYAKPSDVILLDGRIKDVIRENYCNHAGKKFQARTQAEKEKLEKLNRNLNELSIVLASIVDDVAKKVLEREMNRVEDALERLLKFHLESLRKSVIDIAPDLGINFYQAELIKVKFSAVPRFSFKGGFPVVKVSYEASVTKKVGTKRVFFFFEEDVYETSMEKRSIDNATIPSFEDLERGWKIQKDDGEKEVLSQISTWWLEQFEEFNNGIEKFQSDVIERYKERLTLAYQDSTTDYKNKIEIWQPLREEALLVSSKVSQLGTEWRSLENISNP